MASEPEPVQKTTREEMKPRRLNDVDRRKTKSAGGYLVSYLSAVAHALNVEQHTKYGNIFGNGEQGMRGMGFFRPLCSTCGETVRPPRRCYGCREWLCARCTRTTHILDFDQSPTEITICRRCEGEGTMRCQQCNARTHFGNIAECIICEKNICMRCARWDWSQRRGAEEDPHCRDCARQWLSDSDDDDNNDDNDDNNDDDNGHGEPETKRRKPSGGDDGTGEGGDRSARPSSSGAQSSGETWIRPTTRGHNDGATDGTKSARGYLVSFLNAVADALNVEQHAKHGNGDLSETPVIVQPTQQVAMVETPQLGPRGGIPWARGSPPQCEPR